MTKPIRRLRAGAANLPPLPPPSDQELWLARARRDGILDRAPLLREAFADELGQDRPSIPKADVDEMFAAAARFAAAAPATRADAQAAAKRQRSNVLLELAGDEINLYRTSVGLGPVLVRPPTMLGLRELQPDDIAEVEARVRAKRRLLSNAGGRPSVASTDFRAQVLARARRWSASHHSIVQEDFVESQDGMNMKLTTFKRWRARAKLKWKDVRGAFEEARRARL